MSATIYLSTLDANLRFPTKALFDGSKKPLPTTSVPFVSGPGPAGTISRTALSGALKFATTHTSGNAANEPSSITATGSNITDFTKTAMAVNTVGTGRVITDLSASTTNFLGQLSKEIFGSEHSADFFNNQAILATNYKTSLETLDRIVETATTSNVSTEVVNALMLEKSGRFALNYNATMTTGSGSAIAGEHRGVVFTGSVSGVAKTVTVENTASDVTRMTKEAEGHFVPGLNAAALTAANQASPTNLGRLHNDVSLGTAGSGLGATVNIAANGVTNGKITAVTVVSPGSGYALNDVMTIATGALGTNSGVITFKLSAAMLSGSSLATDAASHAALLIAVNEVYIAVVNASATSTITTTAAQGSAGSVGSGLTFTATNSGTTNSTITDVSVTNTGSNYIVGNILTIPGGAFGTGSQAFTITVTAAMLSSGAFSGTGSEKAALLAALQAAKGTITIVNPNSFAGVALQSGAIYNNNQTVTFNATVVGTAVTVVTFTGAGTRMKVGDTLSLAQNILGTNAATIITLTENMISDYGTLLSGNADMKAAFPVATAGTYTSKTGTIVQLAGRKVGKNAVATINVTNANTIESINFTNHGSGYRPGDTVTIPATTLGPASSAISFVVTERMMLESGGILTKVTPTPMTLPGVVDNVTRTAGTNSNVTPTNVTGYGSGSGATFNVVVAAAGISSIQVVSVGKGYKVGDQLMFASNDIGTGGDYTYTIPDGIINQRFTLGERIVSTAGTGLGAGGIGGTAEITVANSQINGVVNLTDGINSVQRAILNESLSSPTEVPLEKDDIIQIKYTINSHLGQLNSADALISIIYDAIFEFPLV